jgi:serine/threonine protein kinase
MSPDDDERTRLQAAPPPPAPADEDYGSTLPMGTRLGEFELLSVLGEGGFGIVYLAQDHSLQRRVALKEYMPSQLAARVGGTQVQVKSARHRDTFEAGLKSFINEARLLAQFDHPSLVKVHRFWEANGTAYMVMPYYQGVTLRDQVRALHGEQRPADETWLRGILNQLCEALAVIHAEQCYHRDIAPDNIILLAGSGKPLLLDFGAARRVIGDMTQALTVILKPGYAPVEQYAEVPHMKQGPWTDVYALGAVVYWCITGRAPPPSVGRMMGQDPYVPLTQCAAGRYSDSLLRAVDQALAVRPEDRPQSVQALAQLLAGAALPPAMATPMDEDERTVIRPLPAAVPRNVAPPPVSSAAAPASSPARSRMPLIAGGGLVGLALLGLALFAMLKPEAPAPAPPPSTAAIEAQPAPAVVAAPVVPVPVFDPAREFERAVALQTPGFGLSASAVKERLVAERDKLELQLSSQRDGYFYVLVSGPEGEFIQLFPNKEAPDNRVRAGQRLQLPERGGRKSLELVVSEPAGEKQLLVLVSAEKRDFGATPPSGDDWFDLLPQGEAALARARELGSAQALMAGSPRCATATPCSADYGAALLRVQVVRGND